MSHNFDEPTEDKLFLLEKIQYLEEELYYLRNDRDDMENDFRRLVNLFNEKITDLYGEIYHIKRHGNNAGNIEREKIIMHNYFARDNE